ncbi:P-loop NTPase fold protein [Pelagibius sp.]|uniref:KAP family P-loop NTPase fold protein n=1 Tax=Pelagibius sp. TaxID=1931238 RepID=UPI0026030291|nr:P-loop NTPase fold protein [Pelagibius sp.]
MPTSPEDELSKAGGSDTDLTPALNTASQLFGFNPRDRRAYQAGVESLQKALIGEGFELIPDGNLGPQTLEFLERSTLFQDPRAMKGESGAFSLKGSDAKTSAPQQTPSRTEQLRSGDVSVGAMRRHAQETEQAAEDLEDEPGTTYKEGEEDHAPSDRGRGGEKTEVSTARPVALSDSAVENIEDDRLGFRPYIEAVSDFILAAQTRPPLALAINARWGQGKTSFMRMLDGLLEREARKTNTRIATTWFNPWMYSEPEQVWAAFIAKVARCIRDHLTARQDWTFRIKRLKTKLHRHADLFFWLRAIIAAVFLSLVASLILMDWALIRDALLSEQKLLKAFYTAATSDGSGYLWYVPAALILVLSVLLAYVTLANKLGLNLLEYVEKTDFKDKIGTLSQFEHEMLKLRESVPDDLKVVVFIDDLDRCKARVLGEVIEALQLAEVSHTCIFVMGMDMGIVAHSIESARPELAQSVGVANRMEHGSGYKFLEKIIQARLTLPPHSRAEMESLVTAAMDKDRVPAEQKVSQPGRQPGKRQDRPEASAPGPTQGPASGFLRRVRKSIGLAVQGNRKTPSDSETVVATAKAYGSRHFDNPRRLKRFINGFRLQTYLNATVRPGAAPVERLARFLVLAEKWPALVEYLLKERQGAEFLSQTHFEDEDTANTDPTMAEQVKRLTPDELTKLEELLKGRRGADPITYKALNELSEWYGFRHYRDIESKT